MKKIIALILIGIMTVSCANAMTFTRAREILNANDPGTAKADRIEVYPSAEFDGAFVTVMKNVHDDGSFYGSFLYVTESEIYELGEGDHNRGGEMLYVTPEVYCNRVGKGQNAKCRAAVLIDNAPVEIRNAAKVNYLTYDNGGNLIGLAGKNNEKRAFLKIDKSDAENVHLCQIKGEYISTDELTQLMGGEAVLYDVKWNAFDVEECIRWGDRVIALNCRKDGRKQTVYMINEDGIWKAGSEMWSNVLSPEDGWAEPYLSLDMPLIETN